MNDEKKVDDHINYDSDKFIQERVKDVNVFTEAVSRFLRAGTPRELYQAMNDVRNLLEDAARAREYLMAPAVKRYLEAKAFEARVEFEKMNGTLVEVDLDWLREGEKKL